MFIKFILSAILAIILAMQMPGVLADNPAEYIYEASLNITNREPGLTLEEGYTVFFQFNTSKVISEEKMLPDARDFRVFYGSESLDWLNLTPINTGNTTFTFMLQTNISSGNSDAINYTINYGKSTASAPPNNGSNVYLFFENFESYALLSELAGQGGWETSEGAPGNFLINSTYQFEGERVLEIIADIPQEESRHSFNLNFSSSLSSFYFKFRSIDEKNDRGFLMFSNDTNKRGIEFFDNDISRNNSLRWTGFSVETDIDVIGSYMINKWYRIDIKYNQTNMTVKITNTTDNSIVNNVLLTESSKINNVSRILIGTSGGQTGDAFFSDLITQRKILNNEPNVTVGNEIESTVNITNCTVGNLIFRFFMYEEENSTYAPGKFHATFDLWSPNSTIDTNSFSFDFAANASHSICISASVETSGLLINATIKYFNETYDDRYFYIVNQKINVTNPLIQPLYMISSDQGTAVTFTLRDIYNIPVINHIIKANRYYISNGSYRLVAMGKTDFDGQVPINLKLNEIYVFTIDSDGVLITEFPQKFLIGTSVNLLKSEGSVIEFLDYFNSLDANCSYSLSASQLTCDFPDRPEILAGLLLKIEQKRLVGGYVNICENTSADASGRIICSFLGHNDTDLAFTFTASFADTIYPLEIGIIKGYPAAAFGSVGIIVLLFIIIGASMVGYWNPTIPIVTSIFGLLVGILMQLIVVSMTAFISLAIAGGIIIYKMKS